MEKRISNQPVEALLERIDATMRELQALRQALLQPQPADQPAPPGDLAQQLYGALGQGSWDEYDLDLDWHPPRAPL